MGVAPCPPRTLPVHGIVTFDPTAFKVAYPEFATVSDAALQGDFARAQLQLNNSCGSRVRNANVRDLLLQLLTAHIAALMQGVNGAPPAGIVGRINEAQEGTVSVGADYGAVVYGQAYYLQTKYGAEYWQATARFRQMTYIPGPPACTGPPWPQFGSGGDWGGGNGI